MKSSTAMALGILFLCSVGINAFLYIQHVFSDIGNNLTALAPGEANDAEPKRLALVLPQTSSEPQEDAAAHENLVTSFQRQQFESAIKEYIVLEQKDAAMARWVKNRWLTQGRTWLATNSLSPVGEFVRLYLREFPYDLDIQRLRAEWLAKTNQISAAIDAYYDIVSSALTPEDADQISREVRALSEKEIKRMREALAWQPMANFAERLLWHEPVYPPYVLALAEAKIRLDAPDEARVQLSLIRNDPYYKTQVEALLSQIATPTLQQAAIPLDVSGSHYVVRGQINGGLQVKLLIDTGASISVISTKYFAQLNFDGRARFVRNALMNTANGKVLAPVYEFPRFQIRQFVQKNMQFAVMDLGEMKGSHGLLGMNFLGDFIFQIDQANRQLVLAN